MARPPDRWKLQAACRDASPDVFFPEVEGNSAAVLALMKEAVQKYCNHCPVMVDCREAAVANDEVHGVWGGLTPGERYGSYKPHTSRASQCPYCLKVFLRSTNLQRYCSDLCRCYSHRKGIAV